MITAILIDDELQNITILDKLLKQYCPEVHVIGQATDAKAAIALIKQQSPQLLFLDVEMPGMDAFDLLNELKPVDLEVILVTAYQNYAIKAFSYNALHYLLKPVDIDDLRLAVQKAAARIMEKNIHQRLDSFIGSNKTLKRIALPTRNGLTFYPIDEIICCTARNTYTLFEFTQHKDLLVAGTLKEFEEILPASQFCRIHNSYLINLDHLKNYVKGKGGQVEMINGKIIEVSLRKRDEFLSRLR